MNISIELEYIKPPIGIEDEAVYKVRTVVNSLNYKPGDILDEEEVRFLCESQFTVRIK